MSMRVHGDLPGFANAIVTDYAKEVLPGLKDFYFATLGRISTSRFMTDVGPSHGPDPAEDRNIFIREGVLARAMLSVRTSRSRGARSLAIVKGGLLILRKEVDVRGAHPNEFGFDGTVQIPAHDRTITQAFGRTLGEPRTFRVGQHTKRLRIPARSYARPAVRRTAPLVAEQGGDLLTEMMNRAGARFLLPSTGSGSGSGPARPRRGGRPQGGR